MKQYLTETKGIAADRIFIDEQAMTTADNAINTFRILREQGIHEITIVTSSYHQCQAHMLFYLVAQYYYYSNGIPFKLIGNFSFETENHANSFRYDVSITILQMNQILIRLSFE